MTDEVFDLRLYVAGQTPKAIRAFANLRTICDEHLAGRYNIEVIDLLEDPQLGRGDQILALPDPGAASSPPRSRRSSATCPTPSACWWAWTCVRVRRDRVTKRPTKSIAERLDQAASRPAREHYVLRLYVTGMTPRSTRAVENVRAICENTCRAATTSRSSTSTSSPPWPRASRSSPRRR